MKKFLQAGALFIALFLQSCDKDMIIDGDTREPLTPGAEIEFGAGLLPQARTVYGDETPVEGGGSVFPIYWSHPSDTIGSCAYDSIYIHSPNAQPGLNHGKYVVKPTDSCVPGFASVEKCSQDAFVAFGEGTHQFYAFYPYSAIVPSTMPKESETHNYVVVNMPVTQRVDVPSEPKDGVYCATYDMANCFMTASESAEPSKGLPVRLPFKPWSTVLDITLPGPDFDGEDATEAVITSVIVRSKSGGSSTVAPCIAGTFKYNFDDETLVEVTDIDGSLTDEPDHIINVNIYGPDGNPGFALKSGQRLNLKAFLVPTTAVEQIDIEVYAKNNKMWSISLAKHNESSPLLERGQIHKVVLPGVVLPGADEYSSWMTNLNGKIRLTSMSIPGSIDSFAGERRQQNVSIDGIVQTTTVAQQFEAGIRAFQVPVSASIGKYDTHLSGVMQNYFEVAGLLGDPAESNLTLGYILHTLHQEMQSRGNQEFCILMLTPNFGNASGMKNFCRLLAGYLRYAVAKDMTIKQIPKDFTLEEVRGKILFQVTLPADPNMTAASNNWNVNTQSGSDYAGTGYIATFENILRVMRPQDGIRAYTWSTPSGSTANDAEPWTWKALEGLPVLMSWDINQEQNVEQVAPLTFGRVGTWTMSPNFYDQETVAQMHGMTTAVFNAKTGGTIAQGTVDKDFVSTEYDALYRQEILKLPQSQRGPQVEATNWGLASIYAQNIWRNCRLLGETDGAVVDSIYVSDVHFPLDTQYDWFVGYDQCFYWCRAMTPMKVRTYSVNSPITYNDPAKAKAILERMWSPASDTGGNIRAVHYSLTCWPYRSFLTTSVGCLTSIVNNKAMVESFVNLTLSADDASDNIGGYKVNDRINSPGSRAPLGVVLLPHITARETSLAGYEEKEAALRREVRKIIKTTADYNLYFDGSRQ